MEPLQNNKEEVLDIGEILGVFLRRFWVILFVGILVGIGTLMYTKANTEPVYTSSTKIYVLTKDDETSSVTSGDLQLSATLATDYAELIKDRTVAESVIEDLGLSISAESLMSRIQVEMPSSGRIITISVSDSDPYMASKLTTAVRDVAAEHIKDVMDTEAVNVVEEAEIPQGQNMDNYKKMGAMGTLAGMILAMAVIFLQYMMNDTVKKPEDVEKYLGLSVLGAIPVEKNKKRNKNKKKKPSSEVEG